MASEVTNLSWYLPVPHHRGGCPPGEPDYPILTDNIVPEADGAEGDEGKVEALTEAPALHVAEEHGREDENDQGPQSQEQSQAQDLQKLGGESLPLRPLEGSGSIWGRSGKSRVWAGQYLSPLTPSPAADFWVGLYPWTCDIYVPSCPG